MSLSLALLLATAAVAVFVARRVGAHETVSHAFQELVARNIVDVVPTRKRLLLRLKRRVLEQPIVLPSGATHAPQFVELRISPEDEETVDDLGGRRLIEADLEALLARHAELEGWEINGRCVVRMVVDPKVRRGQVPPARGRVGLPLEEKSTEILERAWESSGEDRETRRLSHRGASFIDVDGHRLGPDVAPLIVGAQHNGYFAIDDDSVSWRHAELNVSDGVWTIRDLGSMNGTYVDGVSVDVDSSSRLVGSHLVRVGETDLVVRVMDEADR